MLFSERMASFERLKGNIAAGCPDIQAPALSSTFNEVNAFQKLYLTLHINHLGGYSLNYTFCPRFSHLDGIKIKILYSSRFHQDSIAKKVKRYWKFIMIIGNLK